MEIGGNLQKLINMAEKDTNKPKRHRNIGPNLQKMLDSAKRPSVKKGGRNEE